MITECALATNLRATEGETPAATMESQLATSIQQKGEVSPFVRVAPRTYALRRSAPTPEGSTAPSGDKGVDVVGRIALGITEVREVVQVKRHQGNVGRPVLDMLGGSLHRFVAVKGTIIALGGFSKGAQAAAFEAGAAPITLIDGERLLDLLLEHGVGVQTKRAELLELALDDLVEVDAGDEAAEAV